MLYETTSSFLGCVEFSNRIDLFRRMEAMEGGIKKRTTHSNVTLNDEQGLKGLEAKVNDRMLGLSIPALTSLCGSKTAQGAYKVSRSHQLVDQLDKSRTAWTSSAEYKKGYSGSQKLE